MRQSRLYHEATPESIADDGGALVNSSISHRGLVQSLLVYPSCVELVRPKYKGASRDVVPPARTEISGFSDASRRRLRFLAGNTRVPLVTQFCLSYHMSNPDGRTVKRHLDTWLQRLRAHFPGVHHLWVLEFQSRGTPHFHVWLSIPMQTEGLQKFLAEAWHRIAEPTSQAHLAVHMHPNNLTVWDMYSPGYLTKYLDKEYQKHVPAGFVGVGRFWGNSRGLLADPVEVKPDDLRMYDRNDVCTDTGEVDDFNAYNYVIRTICKLHESKLKLSPWRSRARSGVTSYKLQTAAPGLRQIIAHLHKASGQDRPPVL